MGFVGLWGVQDPRGSCISFLLGVSALFGVRLKRRDKSRLRPQGAFTKMYKPHWGKPLLCGSMGMVGKLPVKSLKWTKQEKTKTPAQQRKSVGPPLPRTRATLLRAPEYEQAIYHPHLQCAPAFLKPL